MPTSIITWKRAFYLALKSLIVGLLLGIVWILVYWGYIVFALGVEMGIGDVLLDLVNLSVPFAPITTGSLFMGFPTYPPVLGRLIGLFSGDYLAMSINPILDTLERVLFIAISFLVYLSNLVPIVRYSLNEVKVDVSLLKGYLISLRIAVVGFVLAIIFVLLGFGGLALPLWRLITSPTGEISLTISAVVLAMTFLLLCLLLSEAATGAAVIRFASSEANVKVSWTRCFLISLKASLVGLLWSILIFVFSIAVSAWAVVTMMSSPSVYYSLLPMWLSTLVLAVILISLAPNASLIKYLVEEMKT